MKSEKNKITILVSIIGFLVLMGAAVAIPPHIKHAGIQAFASTVFSTAAAVFLTTGVWELITKQRFADSLLRQMNVSENIASSGLDCVYMDFHKIDWEEEFKNSTSFTAAFVYAYTWRNYNRTWIEAFAKDESRRNKMRIIVPDPENSDVVAELARRFQYKTDETKEKIEKCILDFFELGATVYLFDGSLQASYYLMDNDGIMTFFAHRTTKGTVPALHASKGGQLYDYIQTDINSLISRSSIVKDISIDPNEKRITSIVRDKNE